MTDPMSGSSQPLDSDNDYWFTIKETAPSYDENSGKANEQKNELDACYIIAELLKAGGPAMLWGLHAVMIAIFHSCWMEKGGWSFLEKEGRPSRLQQP